MIRKYNITIPLFVQVYLPHHMRLVNRIICNEVMAYPFISMLEEFVAFRDNAITRFNVTGETISLEWYLNELFDYDLRRIYILSNDADGVPLGLSGSEPDDFQALGLSGSEPDDFVGFNLEGEDALIGLAAFGVFIPAAISAQTEAIIGIVNIYRFAGETFNVIEF